MLPRAPARRARRRSEARARLLQRCGRQDHLLRAYVLSQARRLSGRHACMEDCDGPRMGTQIGEPRPDVRSPQRPSAGRHQVRAPCAACQAWQGVQERCQGATNQDESRIGHARGARDHDGNGGYARSQAGTRRLTKNLTLRSLAVACRCTRPPFGSESVTPEFIARKFTGSSSALGWWLSCTRTQNMQAEHTKRHGHAARVAH